MLNLSKFFFLFYEEDIPPYGPQYLNVKISISGKNNPILSTDSCPMYAHKSASAHSITRALLYRNGCMSTLENDIML